MMKFMKTLLLLICGLALLTGIAPASAMEAELPCAHHAVSASVDADQAFVSAPAPGQMKAEPCRDCGCHHGHVLAKLLPDSVSPMAWARETVFGVSQAGRSQYSPSLYKPPIV